MNILFLSLALFSFNGAFSEAGSGALPRGWMLHTWEGYRPYAHAETALDASSNLPYVRLTEVVAKQGVALRSTRRQTVTPGERIRFSFLGRGKGRATPGLYCYDATGGWLAPIGSEPQPLTAQWQLYECELVVPKDRPQPVAQIEFVMDGSRGGEYDFADMRAERVPGDLMLPRYRDAQTVRTVASDDYERNIPRTSSPSIRSTVIAPGLLRTTKIGTYHTRTTASIALPSPRLSVPEATNQAARMTFRLYDLKGGTLREVLAGRAGKMHLNLHTRAVPALVEGTLSEGTNALATFRMPIEALPADFCLDLNRSGEWGLDITSLSDSSVRRLTGRSALLAQSSEVKSAMQLKAAGSEALASLDNYSFSIVSVRPKGDSMPFSIERLATFDPVKAGWPLTFEDEFNGTSLDTNKWYFPHYAGQHRDMVSLDGQGHLHLKAGLDDKGKLVTDSIWSTLSQRYGYFEARLKFTSAPGWWAAFWLYGPSNGNSFLDGFEVDIFEDYYTRGGKPTLDHNLHIYAPGTLKSWNYNSRLPRGLDAWYVLGCRWTPFEISYYLDGKIIATKSSHTPYDTLTFDAFHHAAGLSPLHAIVSGQIQGDWAKKIDRQRLPETFEVDRVRIYAYPEPANEQPRIAWSAGARDNAMTPEGSVLDFAVEAHPATGTRQPIRGVYLFDNGFPIACRTEPPYEFSIRFSEAAYRHTAYMKAGRSGAMARFNATPHVFVAFAQDAAGRVASTERIWRFPVKLTRAPYEGRAQTIPGKVLAARFDAGGRGVSSFTASGKNDHWDPQRKEDGVTLGRTGWVGHIYAGDWLNYTVDVAEAGDYDVRAEASFGVRGKVEAFLFCDGLPLGTLSLDGARFWHAETTEAGVLRVRLPSGRHVITCAAGGGLVFKSLDFKPLRSQP